VHDHSDQRNNQPNGHDLTSTLRVPAYGQPASVYTSTTVVPVACCTTLPTIVPSSHTRGAMVPRSGETSAISRSWYVSVPKVALNVVASTPYATSVVHCGSDGTKYGDDWPDGVDTAPTIIAITAMNATT
jgi:hypothetical protein